MNALHHLVAALDAARPMTDSPVWFCVRGPTDHPISVDEDGDLGRLVGFVAPPDCSAVGLVTGGWAKSLGGSKSRGGRGCDHSRQRVRCTVLVARDGEVAARLRWSSGRVTDEPPGSGRLLDCLRRSMALPTDPPSIGTGVLFCSIWLCALHQAAQQAQHPMTWADAVELHPVAEIMGEEAPSGTDWLVEGARALSSACPWSEIRRMLIDGAWLDPAIPPNLAAWMDDGMLSRWVLDGRHPISGQLDEVAEGLTPQVTGRVRHTLGQLGLLSG